MSLLWPSVRLFVSVCQCGLFTSETNVLTVNFGTNLFISAPDVMREWKGGGGASILFNLEFDHTITNYKTGLYPIDMGYVCT